MGEKRPPPPSVNVRYVEKLARKDWLRNLQTAYVDAARGAQARADEVPLRALLRRRVAQHARDRADGPHAAALPRSSTRPRRISSRGSTTRWGRSTRQTARAQALLAGRGHHGAAGVPAGARSRSRRSAPRPSSRATSSSSLKADRLLTLPRGAAPRRRDRDERLRSPGRGDRSRPRVSVPRTAFISRSRCASVRTGAARGAREAGATIGTRAGGGDPTTPPPEPSSPEDELIEGPPVTPRSRCKPKARHGARCRRRTLGRDATTCARLASRRAAKEFPGW